MITIDTVLEVYWNHKKIIIPLMCPKCCLGYVIRMPYVEAIGCMDYTSSNKVMIFLQILVKKILAVPYYHSILALNIGYCIRLQKSKKIHTFTLFCIKKLSIYLREGRLVGDVQKKKKKKDGWLVTRASCC
ncbi:unnamed protein product [Prunus armeniaca]